MVKIYSVALDTMHEVEEISKSESEWKAVLDPLTYRVARRKDTEPPFTGIYHDCHKPGIYTCACCGTDLFRSEDKFDSGTGWPSFTRPVSEANIRIQPDMSLGFVRDEVLCALCSAHLGHVFDDGPHPTGLRYCMNSAALRLKTNSS